MVLAGEALLREGLLGALQLDAHLASAIATNHAGGGTELAVHLLRAAAQEANPPLPATSLAATSQVRGLCDPCDPCDSCDIRVAREEDLLLSMHLLRALAARADPQEADSQLFSTCLEATS